MTNSSSSSFIVATKMPVPIEYIDRIEPVTLENLAKVIQQIYNQYCYDDDEMTYNISKEQFKELGGFTDEQVELVKLLQNDCLGDYLRIRKAMEESEEPVYHIYEDRDWLYQSEGMCAFIDSGTIIDKETDL